MCSVGGENVEKKVGELSTLITIAAVVLFDSLQQQHHSQSDCAGSFPHLVGPQVVNMTGEYRLPPSHHGPVLHLVSELGKFVLSNLCTEEKL